VTRAFRHALVLPERFARRRKPTIVFLVALDNPDGDGLAVFTQVFGTQRILDRAAALTLGKFYRGIMLYSAMSPR